MLLHGWPGDHRDYRSVVALLTDSADVVVPDLRGFGESDKHLLPPAEAYSGAAQARSVIGLIEELGLRHVVIAGYDVGSRVAQTIALTRPDVVDAIVVCPPLPGAGERVLTAQAQREFWYQAYHQLDLATEILDGNPSAIRAYLSYFWSHWSGPAYQQTEAELDRLVSLYSAAGSFTASIGWYRASAGTVARSLAELSSARTDPVTVPTTILWPEFDPLFPQEWADRIGEFFVDATLLKLGDVGHFVPLEAPNEFASVIRNARATTTA